MTVILTVHVAAAALCCDLCHPALLDCTRPGAPPRKARKRASKKSAVCEATRSALIKWRSTVHERDYPDALWAATGILSDNLVEVLASAGPIDTKERLWALVGSQWKWDRDYGDELLTTVKLIPRDPMPEPVELSQRALALVGKPKPRKRKAKEDVDDDDGGDQATAVAAPSTSTSMSTPSRPSTSIPTSIPTPSPTRMSAHPFAYPALHGYPPPGTPGPSTPYYTSQFYYPSATPTPNPYWNYQPRYPAPYTYSYVIPEHYSNTSPNGLYNSQSPPNTHPSQ